MYWRPGSLRNYVFNYSKVEFAMKLQKFWWKKWWCVESVREHFINNCVKIVWKKYLLATWGNIFRVWDQKKLFKKSRVFKKSVRKAAFLASKKKTPHDKDTFKNARVLLLLVGASHKKGEEVVLSKKAQQLISHTSSWQEIIIFSSKTFRTFWQLSYWNPRHTIVCEDVILWEQFTQDTQEET